MFSLQAEELADGGLVQLGADDAQLTGDGRRAGADIVFFGNIVKVDPAAVVAFDDALGTKNHAVFTGIQMMQSMLHRSLVKLLVGFYAPGSEDFISMVVMMVMIVAAAGAVFIMLMVMMLMVVMTAAALMLLMMVVVLMVVVATATLMLLMVMMMLVVVVAAAALMFLMVMMMLMVVMTAAALMLLMMMVMLMVVMAAAALVLLMVMVMLMVMVTAAALVFFMMMLMFLLQLCQFSSQSGLTFHGLDQLLAGQLIPGGGNDGRLLVMLTNQGNGCIQLCLRRGIGTGENDGGSGFDLVVVELTEVLHVDLHLAGIADSHGVAQSDLVIGDLFHSGNDIGQLADTGGFDDDPVGVILLDHLRQRLAEVAHQRAADAAGVHLGNVDARILQETTVNADFAEFVLNENQLLALIGFLNHLFDQRGLTCAQKAGVNINFRHNCTFCT